jgi:PAS domain S-box-containing protein
MAMILPDRMAGHSTKLPVTRPMVMIPSTAHSKAVTGVGLSKFLHVFGPEWGKRPRRVLDSAYLAAIVDSSDDAIIGKDLRGIVTSWNRAAETMFGYRADDMIGQPIAVLFPPDRIEEEKLILARIRRGERVEHFETTVQGRHGDRRVADGLADPRSRRNRDRRLQDRPRCWRAQARRGTPRWERGEVPLAVHRQPIADVGV